MFVTETLKNENYYIFTLHLLLVRAFVGGIIEGIELLFGKISAVIVLIFFYCLNNAKGIVQNNISFGRRFGKLQRIAQRDRAYRPADTTAYGNYQHEYHNDEKE